MVLSSGTTSNIEEMKTPMIQFFSFEKVIGLPLFYLFLITSTGHAQVCDSETISKVIFTDLTDRNSALTSSIDLLGDANITPLGTSLTSSSPGSYGGIFFKSAMDFQGTGGFSLKFGIQSIPDASQTGTWEAVVTSKFNREVLPPPFSIGTDSSGRSGWSRKNALVIEIDTFDSGVLENDDNSNHVMVFLSGSEICSTVAPFSIGSGSKHLVWIDYDGFSTQLQIRIGKSGQATKPSSPTLVCNLDIWSRIPISSATYVGFTAYTPESASGAIHRIVDTLAIADAYRPYDDPDCSSYARCAPRLSEVPECVRIENKNKGRCVLVTCDADGYVWDVSGTLCCAFIEKGSWVLQGDILPGTLENGNEVSCKQARKMVAYLTNSENCLF